jgi:hypothetical protein
VGAPTIECCIITAARARISPETAPRIAKISTPISRHGSHHKQSDLAHPKVCALYSSIGHFCPLITPAITGVMAGHGSTPRSSTPQPPSNPHMDLDPKYDDYDYPTTAPETQSGHPGHTTREQDAQVHQLRAMLEQEGFTERLDTLSLLRFLRARKFNVELTKQM